MDWQVEHLIFQERKIGYALIDRNLIVAKTGGAVEILHDDSEVWLGQTLIDLVPELIGNEDALHDILTDQLSNLELSLVNRTAVDGSIIYLTMVILPHRRQGGEIAGLLYLVDDVTSMGMLEQQVVQQRNELSLLRDQLNRQNMTLAAANTDLQRLSEMKSAFVSIAAHELRTPLASISGYIEMMIDEDVGPLNEEQREYLGIVANSTTRLLEITTNLLDLTRIESERVELVLQPTNLVDLIEMALIEFEPQVETHGHRLNLQLPEDLPPVLVDKIRTNQIIGNLVSNAIKYTPTQGAITVSAQVATQEGFVQVSIVDDGVGIGRADQEKLFWRFFRAQSASKAGASGTGLGLYITRSLVELHGGRIWFESELGQGSTFHNYVSSCGLAAMYGYSTYNNEVTIR